jgi:hypothetical protein
MPLNEEDATRRRLLKGIGATGLALSAASVTAASDGGDAPEATTDESEPAGEWDYTCDQDTPCCSGDGCQQYRRYCANGDCSGWERSGCCPGDCAPISCS